MSCTRQPEQGVGARFRLSIRGVGIARIQSPGLAFDPRTSKGRAPSASRFCTSSPDIAPPGSTSVADRVSFNNYRAGKHALTDRPVAQPVRGSLDLFDPLRRGRTRRALPGHQGNGPVVDLLDRHVDVRRVRQLDRRMLVPVDVHVPSRHVRQRRVRPSIVGSPMTATGIASNCLSTRAARRSIPGKEGRRLYAATIGVATARVL